VRQAHGLSLRQAAARAGIDPGHLSRVERGRGGLSIEALARLAKVLGLRELERLLKPYAIDPQQSASPAFDRAQGSRGTEQHAKSSEHVC
jgi:transcriptional regulator with XRE-family HTH domain